MPGNYVPPSQLVAPTPGHKGSNIASTVFKSIGYFSIALLLICAIAWKVRAYRRAKHSRELKELAFEIGKRSPVGRGAGCVEWRDMHSDSDSENSGRRWETEDDRDLEKGVGERRGDDLKRWQTC